ncbi:MULTISPECIES: hypothetical protein [unclassified Luteimonas]
MLVPNGLRGLRAVAAALVVCISLSGCLSARMYVDPTLPVVGSEDFTTPTDPQSANVLFEFRTKGNANARATQETRLIALEAVRKSGLFSDIVDGGAKAADSQLKIVIDNVPVTENAAAKGVGTGLTLGLAGSMVTDGYLCTASYTSGGVTTETTVEHALHTTIGNHGGPEGLQPVPAQQAVETIVSQMVLNALKQLGDDNAFGAP